MKFNLRKSCSRFRFILHIYIYYIAMLNGKSSLAFHRKKCTLLRFSSAWKLLDLLHYSLAASACVCVCGCVGDKYSPGKFITEQIEPEATSEPGAAATNGATSWGKVCKLQVCNLTTICVARRGEDAGAGNGKKRIACKINADSWVSA